MTFIKVLKSQVFQAPLIKNVKITVILFPYCQYYIFSKFYVFRYAHGRQAMLVSSMMCSGPEGAITRRVDN